MEATDEQLASLAVTGDTAAFGELVRRHQGLVRSLLLRLTGDHAQADDIAQDAFIRAFERVGNFSGTGSFKSWLCRIAYNQFLMAARKGRARARMLAAFGAGGESSTVPPDLESAVDLQRALATLRQEERRVVVLCYAGGLSHSEVAEIMKMPLGTVKSHVNRGRRKLQLYFGAATEGAL